MAKILIVEDEAMVRDIISRRLAVEGYQVVSAADGARGVAMARAEQPDLILMDMGLPVLNGWQATHRIKTRPETSTTPIIALTAYALAEDKTRCLDAGCDEYETKPIDFPRLLVKMRTLLDRAGSPSPE